MHTSEVVFMGYMLVRHEVKDFKNWKHVYDADANNRKLGGSKGARVFRNVDNPQETFMLFNWTNKEDAVKFGQSEKLKKTMMDAGVMEVPDFTFLEEVETTPA